MKYGILENNKFLFIDDDKEKLINTLPFIGKSKKDIETFNDNEIECCYDGCYYKKGFAPTQPANEYNEQQSEKRSQAYIERTDPLTLRKLRKLALGEWTSEDEKDYIYQMQKISEEINKEFAYIVDNNDSTVENTDNTLIFEDAK